MIDSIFKDALIKWVDKRIEHHGENVGMPTGIGNEKVKYGDLKRHVEQETVWAKTFFASVFVLAADMMSRDKYNLPEVKTLTTDDERPAYRTLPELERERFAWSMETFTEATAVSSLRKLESETKEIEADILNGSDPTEEYADALMCLFDSAGRHGITVERITEAFAKKLEVNKARIWRKNPDDSYSHV